MVREDAPVTTDDLSLLVAETRCAHGRLTLDDAERAGTGDDWIAYLRDPLHPCPYAVRDYAAYQTHAPHLPADWLVLRTRAARHGRDYGAASGTITLPEVAHLLAAGPASADGPVWLLYAIHRTGPTATADRGVAATYLVEAADPTTGEVRAALSLAAYPQLAAATPVVPAVSPHLLAGARPLSLVSSPVSP